MGTKVCDVTAPEDLRQMLTFANGAASIITTRKGALNVMPTKAEVEELIGQLS